MNGKRRRSLLAAVATVGIIAFTACTPPSDDQRLKEQAAQATEQAKQGSKEALADARVAAKNAEQAVNDVAAGVKQGLDTKGAPDSGRLDLNAATLTDLETLPGISARKAKQIIDHRPYASSHELVKDGLITEAEFNDIAPKVTVH
jgi:DNA uptake protein ComE-like DNA-binding protein